MTPTSGKTYKELSIPYFNEVFLIMDEVLSKLGITYYLIGVNAMALELLAQGHKPGRGTKDIDFAIMISSFDDYDEVVKALEIKGFNKAKAPWTFYHPEYKTVVDVLPFGEIEQKDTEKFYQRYSDLHIVGIKEVLDQAKEIKIEEKIARIPPLHGMVLLKLVAWSDRPEERFNDPYDILVIIDHYFKIEFNEIMLNHFDAFPEEGFDERQLSSRVLGRKVAEILKHSEALTIRIMNLLIENTFDPQQSPIAVYWAGKENWTLEYAQSLLIELKKGIEETLKLSN